MHEPGFHIAPATPADVPTVHRMILALADHLGLAHAVVATESDLADALFGPQPRAEVLLAWAGDAPAGFALYYGNYSTFRGRCGLHLEDLYVEPAWRSSGIGRGLLARLAQITLERGCGRLEWWVLSEDAKATSFYEAIGAAAQDEWTVFRLKGPALQQLAAWTPASDAG